MTLQLTPFAGASEAGSVDFLAANESPLRAPEAEEVDDSLDLFLREIGRHKLLTPAEEIELARRIERGNPLASERMIVSNLRLVVSIAKRFRGRGVPLADLIQEGAVGLQRAVEKFDWRQGCRFSTYGSLWIEQACRRALERQAHTIRIPAQISARRSRLRRAAVLLESELGRRPTVEELARATDISPRHAVSALGVAEAETSLSQAVGRGELLDLLPDADAIDPIEETSDRLRRERVRRAVRSLTLQERRVIELRFGFDGSERTATQTGRLLGLSRQRIRETETSALAKLFFALAAHKSSAETPAEATVQASGSQR
jgi:RNA polymerase primary sigma factor